MDEDKYIKLIKTSYQSIRKTLGNIKIFETHQETVFLSKIITDNNMVNVEIVDDYWNFNKCRMRYFFLTAAILVSLLLNIPLNII